MQAVNTDDRSRGMGVILASIVVALFAGSVAFWCAIFSNIFSISDIREDIKELRELLAKEE